MQQRNDVKDFMNLVLHVLKRHDFFYVVVRGHSFILFPELSLDRTYPTCRDRGDFQKAFLV